METMSELRRELDGLTFAARAFDAQHQPIADPHYPCGVRIAVNLTVDFDAMLLRRLLNEPPMQLAKGEFGGRVGIWRLLELFDSHRITATIFTPGRICELYPKAVQAAAQAGHEIGDHMWEHRVPDDPALERDHLTKATAALEKLAGKRPVGTRSWHTQRLLIELGYIYNSHGYSCHNPYYLRAGADEKPLLNLPFHCAIDDAMFFSFAWLGSGNAAQRITDPDRVFELWWAAFWQQYRAGGYLNVVVHPFVSGRALRIAMLDRLITRMRSLPGVWFCTCEEMARHCLANSPPAEA
jgi:peptidoglycan/xylan/chitin deacetylase (PgdA/CDA1 family)